MGRERAESMARAHLSDTTMHQHGIRRAWMLVAARINDELHTLRTTAFDYLVR